MPARWFVILMIVMPLAWLFGGIFWRGEQLDFRDIGHYYRPLWHWTSSEWAAGRAPLWCDLEGLGMPVHADPTASLFYPGQVLLLLPIGFSQRLTLYVVAHLLLAAALLYRTARVFGASPAAATAGALSYSLGGHVLFQYCNPIYLVGAAWSPLALLAIERMATLGTWRWCLVLAVSMAFMVLGGDPQAAYHSALLAAAYFWLARHHAAASPSRHPRPVALLAVSFLLAAALSAVQLLPALQWSARSERSLYEHPRSLWEIGRAPDVSQGLLASPPSGSHLERVYDFSVPPWRWLEFVWPNIGGRMFPAHHRWMSALPADARVWSPSLYLGLAPLLAALLAFNLRRNAPPATRWLSSMTLLGVLGSLGAYGLGWLGNEIWAMTAAGGEQEPAVFGGVGGLYWLLVVALPGYVQFRYPAKLLLLTSLGIALLASRGWDECFSPASVWRLRRWNGALLLIVGGSSVACLGILLAADALRAAPAEFPFGPLSVLGATRDVWFAAAHASLLFTLLYALARWRGDRSWLPATAAVLTAIDLCLAHGWMISASPPIVSRMQRNDERHPPRTYRGSASSAAPDAWNDTSSPARLAEVLAWQYAFLGEKTYLESGVNVVNATNALEPADLAALWRTASGIPPHAAQESGLAPALAIGWKISPDATTKAPVLARLDANSNRSKIYAPQQVIWQEPSVTRNPKLLREKTAIVFSPNAPVDRRQTAIFEVPKGDGFTSQSFPSLIPSEAFRLRKHSPTHLEIECDLPEERWVVLADYFSPGWQAKVFDSASGRSHTTPILRANRVLRAMRVPAGPQRLELRYRPQTLIAGAVISVGAWLVVAGAGVYGLGRKRLSLAGPPIS